MSSRDAWEKFEILAKGLGSILIPILVVVMGSLITGQQKKSEAVHRQAERAEMLLKHMMSENAKEKLVAVQMMEYLVDQGEFPVDLVPPLKSMVEEEKDARLALEAGIVMSKLAEKEPALKNVATTSSQLPPRIYIHIKNESQRPYAKSVGKALADKGYKVPGVERIVDVDLLSNELRFFKKSEREEADRIAAYLKILNVNVIVKDLSQRYENSQYIRPGHFELWFNGHA